MKESDDLLFLMARTGHCVAKLDAKSRKKHMTEDNQLKPTSFFRSYREDTNKYAHTQIGDLPIREVFNYSFSDVFI